ncbi:unnamed protein product, partial [Iphiclides podalirius]
MMDWEHSALSGASSQCHRGAFSLVRKPISPKSYDISICQGGRKMELRLRRKPNVAEGARKSPSAPEASRARRAKPAY